MSENLSECECVCFYRDIDEKLNIECNKKK